jgi:hypothetical protein
MCGHCGTHDEEKKAACEDCGNEECTCEKE